MADEKYINRNLFGDIEISDTPDSFLQQGYIIEESFLRPGVLEAHESHTLGIGQPAFELHHDHLGNLSVHEPSGSSYGGYSGGAYAGGGSGHGSTQLGADNGSGAVWLVFGFWWALVGWWSVTVQRSWEEGIVFIAPSWALWGAALLFVNVIAWRHSGGSNSGLVTGVMAAVAQVGVWVWALVVLWSDGDDLFTRPMPYSVVLLGPVLHTALFALASLRMHHKRRSQSSTAGDTGRFGTVLPALAGSVALIAIWCAGIYGITQATAAVDRVMAARASATPEAPDTGLTFSDETRDTVPFDPAWGAWGDWTTRDKPTIQRGDRGNAVRYLQGVLRLRLERTEVEIDGRFGPKTEEAVRTLQAFSGLPADGVVGPDTWSVIDTWSARE